MGYFTLYKVYIANTAHNPLFISNVMGQSGQLYYVLDLLKVSSHLNGYILLIRSNNVKSMLWIGKIRVFRHFIGILSLILSDNTNQ